MYEAVAEGREEEGDIVADGDEVKVVVGVAVWVGVTVRVKDPDDE